MLLYQCKTCKLIMMKDSNLKNPDCCDNPMNKVGEIKGNSYGWW